MTEQTDLPALIADVHRLSAQATPGPWVAEPDGGPHRGRVEERSPRGIETIAYTYCGAYDGHGARNAELVAHYRTAAPLLADECERLRASEADTLAMMARGVELLEEAEATEAALKAECSRLQERVRVLEAALRPFAKARSDGIAHGVMLKTTEPGGLYVFVEWCDAARAALEGIEVE